MSESQTPPLLDGLTTLEQRMVDAARCGDWAAPNTATRVELLEATDDPCLRVRADLIRELLMGRRDGLDPRGLRIRGARVVGLLDLDHITAVIGLTLERCALPDGVRCVQARLREVDLSGSRVSSLRAENLRTEGSLSLRDAVVIGSGELGAVRLSGADIGGQLDIKRAEITNDNGSALYADNLHVGESIFLEDAILCGAGEDGAVRLPGAYIGHQLNLDRTVITNDTDSALHAVNVRVGNSMLLRDAQMTGTDDRGAVRLSGARISGRLLLDGIQVVNPSGPLIELNDAQVIVILCLPASVVCPQALTKIRGKACPDDEQRLAVRGLVFSMLERVEWRQWLHLLRHHTPAYTPQPYQQLAAVERASGHDNNARQVLITQQEDLRRRTPEALGGRLAQARHRWWGRLGSYGYRAHRIVAVLALILVLAGGLGYIAGQVPTRPGHHAAERVPSSIAPAKAPGTPCSTIELIGLGIDRGLPLGATGLRVRCDLDTATRRGQAFTVAIWILQALVWALATLAVAAYTGLVRKLT